VIIPANEVVPGDVLLLAPGDRVAADARLLSSYGLEVDEAALTGESMPVAKAPTGGTDASHIVLEGSDVTSGSGRAVVVAVGWQTRMGATAAALSVDEIERSPLGVRLNQMLRVLLPLSIGGGGIVLASGFLRRIPLVSLLTIGMTVVLAAIPEGLPLLASIGEAGVARRLAGQNAVVRRLSAIEALGRVDVACTDKTGTLTKGQLALSMVADYEQEAKVSAELSTSLRRVLLTAALASPHPSAQDAQAHPTDVAIIQGAIDAGLGEQLHVEHEAELPFDPVRSFHVTLTAGSLCVKGAPEVLIPRCSWMLEQGEKRPLDEHGRSEWLDLARRLAERGLRVLMVAEGSPATPLDNPRELTALGFVGISDPLRPNVQAAVHRCREAGVRVIMITGDHPSTARAIAREADLLDKDGEVLTGAEILELQNSELDEHLEHAVVIARATPLDKLRIIESLQRQGHTIAMTGDGVNDAPALRLADVGVAMGRGTEVARQVADVILVDDDFSTLVEAFVEGRSYWRNIRRALGLLLGGNLGELGLIVGASLLGLNFPLTARQILSMNVITDILPSLAVALQQPEHHSLAGLDREGAAALGTPLRNDILRRTIASALPPLVSYLIMLGSSTLPAARSVAYGSIIATQLAQTLDAGRAEGRLTRSVLGAVAGSAGILLATFALPPLRTFLNLVIPPPLGWVLIGSGSVVAVLLSRLLSSLRLAGPAFPQTVAQPTSRLQTA
jgi:calcium-translocating P-type ATPase